MTMVFCPSNSCSLLYIIIITVSDMWLMILSTSLSLADRARSLQLIALKSGTIETRIGYLLGHMP